MKKLYFLLSVVCPVLTVIFLYYALGMDNKSIGDDIFGDSFDIFIYALICGVAVAFELDWIYSAFYFFTKTWKKTRWKTVLNIVSTGLTFLNVYSIIVLSVAPYWFPVNFQLMSLMGFVALMCAFFHLITRFAYIILLIIEKCSQPKTVSPDCYLH